MFRLMPGLAVMISRRTSPHGFTCGLGYHPQGYGLHDFDYMTTSKYSHKNSIGYLALLLGIYTISTSSMRTRPLEIDESPTRRVLGVLGASQAERASGQSVNRTAKNSVRMLVRLLSIGVVFRPVSPCFFVAFLESPSLPVVCF